MAGFSGGADSTALLLAVAAVAEELKIDLTAVHFEHGIRGEESLRDAAWCQKFCAAREIPFRLIPLNVPARKKPGESLEAAARRMRTEHWQAIAADAVVALGHHADDLTENILIRFCRGANATGLTSLRPIQSVNGITVIRPLLEVSRKEIIAFLRQLGITQWCEDSTNSDDFCLRNFFRNKVIAPLAKKYAFAVPGIRRSAAALQDDADFIEATAKLAFRSVSGGKITPLEFWRDLHPAVRQRVLRLWLSEATGTDYIPDANFAARFAAEISRNAVRGAVRIPLNGSVLLRLNGGNCEILTKLSATISAACWRWRQDGFNFAGKKLKAGIFQGAVLKKPENDYHACFDARMLPEAIIVSSWQPGSRMIPWGGNVPVRLKKIFNDRKIAAENRPAFPVLALADGTIIWLAGIRRADYAPVTPNTGETVLFSWE